MKPTLSIALLLIAVTPAFAADPEGCDKFKWPMDKEIALLTAPSLPKLAAGVETPAPPVAVTMTLSPIAEAVLPNRRSASRSRTAMPDSFAPR